VLFYPLGGLTKSFTPVSASRGSFTLTSKLNLLNFFLRFLCDPLTRNPVAFMNNTPGEPSAIGIGS
ncbi:hypothetical protein BgiBS90_012258, partial [Biomphalaria glabrata]